MMLILKSVGDIISERLILVNITFLKDPLSIHHLLSLFIINDQRTMAQCYSSEQYPFWFARLHKMTEPLKDRTNSEPLQKSQDALS